MNNYRGYPPICFWLLAVYNTFFFGYITITNTIITIVFHCKPNSQYSQTEEWIFYEMDFFGIFFFEN